MSVIVLATAATVEPWEGAIVIGVLASTVAFLFRWADKRVTEAAARDAAHAIELGKRDVREATIRAECQALLAAQAEKYAEALRREHNENRTHEDQLRKEYEASVDKIGQLTAKSAEALTEVLGKLHDRFTGVQRPRGKDEA